MLADDPVLAEVTRQTDLLLETAHGLQDAHVPGSTLCPGWTVGHVLTHVARNADALRTLLEAARAGQTRAMYPDRATRDGDIEAGASRSASVLEADVETSADRLLDACVGFPPEGMAVPMRLLSGRELPVSSIPWLRWREVVLHHADLGTGYTLEQAGPLVVRLLEETCDAFGGRDDVPPFRLVAEDLGREWTIGGPGATVRGTATALATWLTGRGSGSGVEAEPALPTLPSWA